MGDKPAYANTGFIDDPLTALFPQGDLVWGDTAGTDSSATAAGAKKRSWRREAHTTTSTADQVLFTIPLSLDDATSEIGVVISGKQGAAQTGCTMKLNGSFVRRDASGGVVRLGSDDIGTVKANGALVGTTFDLNINGNAIEVRVTPGSAADVKWNVTAQSVEEQYA